MGAKNLFDDDYFLDIVPQGTKADDFSIPQFSVIKDGSELAHQFDFNGFEPFVYQAALINAMEERGFVKSANIVLPRRFGKTVVMIVYLIKMGIKKAQTIKRKLPVLKYGMVYPDLINGKDTAWDDMLDKTEGLPQRKKNAQQGFIEWVVWNEHLKRNMKVRLQIVGLQNMDKRRGRGFDGLVIDESGFTPFGSEKILLPMLADEVRKPTFLIRIGTPTEEGDFWEKYDEIRKKEIEGNSEFFTFWSDYDRLKHIPQEEYENLCRELSPAEVDIELGCKRGVRSGALYFSHEIAQIRDTDRQRDIVVDQLQKKIISVDIGASKSDLFAMWVAQLNKHTGLIEFIDYWDMPNATPESITQQIQNWGYSISQFVIPWDGATGLVPFSQILQDKYPEAKVIPLPKGKKLDRINATRRFLGRCVFDRQKTLVGFNCLKNFAKKFDKEKRIYLMEPKHDRNSHGADAFGHFAQAYLAKELQFDEFGGIGFNQAQDVAESYEPINQYMGR